MDKARTSTNSLSENHLYTQLIVTVAHTFVKYFREYYISVTKHFIVFVVNHFAYYLQSVSF